METQTEACEARNQAIVEARTEPLAIGSQECESSVSLSTGVKDSLKPTDTPQDTRGQTNGEVVVNGVREEEGKACPGRSSSTTTDLLIKDDEANFEVSELIKEILNQSSCLDEGLNGLNFVTGLGSRQLEGQLPLFLEGSEARSSTPDSDSNMRTASEGSSTPTSQLSVPSSTSDNHELRITEKEAIEDTKDSGVECRMESHEELSQHNEASEENDSSSSAQTGNAELLHDEQTVMVSNSTEGDDQEQRPESELPVPVNCLDALLETKEPQAATQDSYDTEPSETTLNRDEKVTETDRPGEQDTPASPDSGKVEESLDEEEKREEECNVSLVSPEDADDEAERVSMMAQALENLILSALSAEDQEQETEITLDSPITPENPELEPLQTEAPVEVTEGGTAVEEPTAEGEPLTPESVTGEKQPEDAKMRPEEVAQRQEQEAGDTEWPEVTTDAGQERLQEANQELKATDVPTSMASSSTNSECVCKR